MVIVNKKAKADYQILESLEAGIVLTGVETKAVRAKKVDFLGSYIKPLGGEMFIINMHIGFEGEGDTRRTRKLLLGKKQILALSLKQNQQKLTLVPLSLYTKGRLIKCELALAKGRKSHEKRERLKQRDIEREIEREMSPKLR